MRSWSVEREQTVDTAGRREVSITLRAVVCPAGDTDAPEVVAFSFEPSGDVGGEIYRKLMSTSFPESPRFVMTLEPAEDAYYDVLISPQIIEADSTLRDNTGDIALLKRFLPAEAIANIPDQVQRVSVRVMARAERFIGASELVEVGTSARDITPEMDPEPVIRELVKEALVETAKRLYARLTAGAP